MPAAAVISGDDSDAPHASASEQLTFAAGVLVLWAMVMFVAWFINQVYLLHVRATTREERVALMRQQQHRRRAIAKLAVLPNLNYQTIERKSLPDAPITTAGATKKPDFWDLCEWNACDVCEQEKVFGGNMA